MKRGGELKRKTPLRVKAPTYRTVVIDAEDSAAVEPFTCLPKLPPIPGSLAKAVKKATRRPKTTKARKAAQGRACQIRVPGYCEQGTETVVLCHYRLSGLSGTGMKPPDWLGAYGCATCHSCVDGRIKTPHSHDTLRLWHAEGCFRTMALIKTEE